MYFDSILVSKATPEEVVIRLAKECNCDKCKHGCNYGSGTMKKGQEKQIAKLLGISEDKLKKEYLEEVTHFNTKLLRPKIIKKDKQHGKCIFFDTDKKEICKIYKHRPLQCKISNFHDKSGEQLHSWFILNHCINPNDAESIRQYAQYLKFNNTIPGGTLLELVRNKIKLRKMLNYEILK